MATVPLKDLIWRVCWWLSLTNQAPLAACEFDGTVPGSRAYLRWAVPLTWAQGKLWSVDILRRLPKPNEFTRAAAPPSREGEAPAET